MTMVLLVEDDDRLRRALAIALRTNGHGVVEAGSVAEAGEATARMLPDCAVVDLGLPDGSGLTVIAHLRDQWPTLPIIVLSARRDPQDKVAALDMGADDYVTKPFGIDELLARIRAGLRRSARASGFGVRRTDDFVVDLDRARVIDRSGRDIRLTPTEWGMLACLVTADGAIVPTAQLLEEVWGERGREQASSVRVHMTNLRHKLEPDPRSPRYLVTVPGAGYRFVER